MYVPKDFALDDPAQIAAVMKRHAFALLVTAAGGAAPVATHLPFLYDASHGSRGRLRGHMARANPQWRDFAALAEKDAEALVIFPGPHAYVSPRWYRPGAAVPTWNYVAVHAYGTPAIVDDDAAVDALLRELVAEYEAGADRPWSLDGQEAAFLARMRRGIVAFEIPIARLEAKAKLSQNRTPEDRRGVIDGLRASGRPDDGALAALMAAREDE